MANNAANQTIKQDNKMQFGERYFDNLRLTTVSDDFGRPSNKWTVKNVAVGTYPRPPTMSILCRLRRHRRRQGSRTWA